jgi:hypothetical protein
MALDWEPAPGRPRWRAAVLAAVVVAVGLGAMALRHTADGSDGRLRITPSTPGPSVAEHSGWTLLPDPGLPPRAQPLTLWTGDEVLVIGGDGRRDGAAWNPLRQRWRRLPDAPVPLRSNIAVWTGDGGVVVTPDATLHLDPAAAAWQQGPPPPRGLLRDVLPVGDAVAVGDVVIVAGPGDPAAALYDLRRRRWRTLEVPRSRQFIHTPAIVARGPTVLLFGDTGNDTVGWFVRLDDERPRRLPPVPDDVIADTGDLVWFRAAASVDATYVLGRTVGGTAWRAAELEQSSTGTPRRWRSLPEVPLEPRRQPLLAWTADGLIVWSTELGRGARYLPEGRRWRPLPPAPLPASTGTGTATPDGLFVWVDDRAAQWTVRAGTVNGPIHRYRTVTSRRTGRDPRAGT